MVTTSLIVLCTSLIIVDIAPCFDPVFFTVGYFLFRRLVEKLDNMHNNAIGDGRDTCLLCGSKFGTLKVVAKRCDICEKVHNNYQFVSDTGHFRPGIRRNLNSSFSFGKAALKFFLPWATLSLLFQCFTCTSDDLSDPLPIRQVRMKRYLPRRFLSPEVLMLTITSKDYFLHHYQVIVLKSLFFAALFKCLTPTPLCFSVFVRSVAWILLIAMVMLYGYACCAANTER